MNKQKKDNILYAYDIEFQSLNDLLIKNQIKKSDYNKSMKYNNKMLKIDLKREGVQMKKNKICRVATIQIQLEYVFENKTDEEINNIIENIELPKEYKEDSYKLISIN